MDVSELTPSRCVECGAQVSGGLPVILAFDSGDDAFEIVEVPGLRRCRACFALMQAGRLVSNIDPGVAFRFLTEEYLPRVRSTWLAAPELRRRITEDIEFATDTAMAIAAKLIACGPMRFDGIEAIVETADDDQGEQSDCGHEVDPVKILASIRIDDKGNTTFVCPHCEMRHDAADLKADLFEGITADSKD